MLAPKEETAPESAAYRSQIILKGVSRNKPSTRLERSYGRPTNAVGFAGQHTPTTYKMLYRAESTG